MNLKNISENWKGSTRQERRICQGVLKRELTPNAVRYFTKKCSKLGDYWYWFLLSTIWVSYSGFSDLEIWKKLFSSKREGRESSIMKPDELECFRGIPDTIIAYRAHRENERDWISYTAESHIAVKFARQRNAGKITEYIIRKSDLTALFLRRGEMEFILLNKNNALKVKDIKI